VNNVDWVVTVQVRRGTAILVGAMSMKAVTPFQAAEAADAHMHKTGKILAGDEVVSIVIHRMVVTVSSILDPEGKLLG